MNKKKSKEVNDQIEYGLASIEKDRTIELKLKDFMLLYKTIEEFNRFFHQPAHIQTTEDLETYMGNKNSGAYSFIHRLYYKVLPQYLPDDIESNLLDKDINPFEHPNNPYYFKENSDYNIDDGTVEIKDRESFVEFVKKLLNEYRTEGSKWENNSMETFIEGIASYANDIDGYYKNMNFKSSPDASTWRIFAQILKGATIYE